MVADGGRHRLSSLLYPAVWEPGAAFHACCRRRLAALPWGRLPLHEPPNIDCVCGVYAVSTAERALPYLRAEADARAGAVHRVVGTVALWGRAVEAAWGWRAENAYPVRLVVPAKGVRRPARLRARPSIEGIATDLGAYGVEVVVGDPAGLVARGGGPPARQPLPVSLGSGMRTR